MKTGIAFDFENNDIIIRADGTILKTEISSQICALISLSQITRLTKPEVGAQVGSRLINNKESDAPRILTEAQRMVVRDGGTNVSVDIIDGKLQFIAEYGN